MSTQVNKVRGGLAVVYPARMKKNRSIRSHKFETALLAMVVGNALCQDTAAHDDFPFKVALESFGLWRAIDDLDGLSRAAFRAFFFHAMTPRLVIIVG